MVYTEIPKHYNLSPSFSATPQLTINRDVTQDLDSSNAFEGPEKLLEVWFSPSATSLPARASPLGLKAVPAETWKEMLELVNCQVLSIINFDTVDAYLLSESSMFVFPHKLILKTCGTTTLLCGLPRILEIAATAAGFPHVAGDLKAGIATASAPYRVFYSRKNFLFPERQRGPHRSWRDEVRTLDKLFSGGSAYMIGKMNGEHWYLYLTEPNTLLTPPATPELMVAETETKHIDLPASNAKVFVQGIEGHDEDDETLEILMTDLDEEKAKQFYLDHASAVAEGRFFERAHEARKEVKRALSAIDEFNEVKKDISEEVKLSEDTFDVFSNTSSDNGELAVEDEAFPVELTCEGHALGTVVSEASGLSDIYPVAKYPDARVDAYMFNPCGFSANGVIPAPTSNSVAHYFTVHVTPEPNCSYASFETNVPCHQTGRETAELVEQVVAIFKPGRFSVTVFETKPHVEEDKDENGSAKLKPIAPHPGTRKSSKMETIRGYRRVDRIVHDLEGYELVFRYYERWDWQGSSGPRIGEVF